MSSARYLAMNEFISMRFSQATKPGLRLEEGLPGRVELTGIGRYGGERIVDARREEVLDDVFLASLMAASDEGAEGGATSLVGFATMLLLIEESAEELELVAVALVEAGVDFLVLPHHRFQVQLLTRGRSEMLLANKATVAMRVLFDLRLGLCVGEGGEQRPRLPPPRHSAHDDPSPAASG